MNKPKQALTVLSIVAVLLLIAFLRWTDSRSVPVHIDDDDSADDDDSSDDNKRLL